MANSKNQGALPEIPSEASPIAITGGSGFLGTALARYFVNNGHQVTIIDSVPPAPDLQGRISFKKADITHKAELSDALRGAKLIYHLAAIVPVSKQNKTDFFAINVTGTEHVLAAAEKENARVVFCSTSSPLYTNVKELPVTETTPKSPGYFYGKSKYAAEEVCDQYRKNGLRVAIVRPRMIIGPGRLGLLEILFGWISEGKSVPLLGGGKNLLQFLDVDDLVDVLRRLANASDSVFNQDYNVGAKKFATFKEDIQSVINHAASSSKLVPVPAVYKPLLLVLNLLNVTPISAFHINTIDQNFYFDSSKAERNLGWHSNYSNSESLIRSFDWYRANIQTVEQGSAHNKRLGKLKIMNIVSGLLELYADIQNMCHTTALHIATVFGLGRIVPFGQGTLGSLAAMPFVLFFISKSLPVQLASVALITIVAIFSAGVFEKKNGITDDKRIIIDEFVSIFVTFIGFTAANIHGHVAIFLVFGFLLNRFFDILKPFPANVAERLHGGLGIVLDDIIASVYAHVALIGLMMLVALF